MSEDQVFLVVTDGQVGIAQDTKQLDKMLKKHRENNPVNYDITIKPLTLGDWHYWAIGSDK